MLCQGSLPREMGGKKSGFRAGRSHKDNDPLVRFKKVPKVVR